MRARWIIGNWKLHGRHRSNQELLSGIVSGMRNTPERAAACMTGQVMLAVAVSHPYLHAVAESLKGSGIVTGAQDCAEQAVGAFTGEVAAGMVADCGGRFVLVGHSERRQYFYDSDVRVAAKTVAALAAGLTPIVCLGETLAAREAGTAESVVLSQLNAVIDVVGVSALDRLVLAYEPRWAIGTGQVATPEQANHIHQVLRARLQAIAGEAGASVSILYGGSVKPENASDLFAMSDIDGGLIGGAALKATDFLGIWDAAIKAIPSDDALGQQG